MGIIKRDLYDMQHNMLAQAFDYLSHPGRLKIILMLLINNCLTLSQIQEQLGLSQSASSDQVGVLKNAGLIQGVQFGNSILYSLNREKLTELREISQHFWQEVQNL